MSNNRDKQIEKFAGMFKALSNPNRLKIFLRLAALCMPGCCMPGVPAKISKDMKSEGCACVGDLGQELDIVSSTVSHHIKELKRVGLIDVTRRGQRIECRINPDTMAAFQGFFS